MSDRELSARPNLEQYKNQAKDLVNEYAAGVPDALIRVRRHHPRFHRLPGSDLPNARFTRTDAQLVLARELGFESWPKLAKHIEMRLLIESVAALDDPVSAFIEVACVPRYTAHVSGTLEHAEMILSRYPHVAKSNIYTAAILGDKASVQAFLLRDPKDATAAGGPHDWDALTYLCFSRYLRLDAKRSDAFVKTARVLLDNGARADTGWTEMIDHPTPRPTFESALYGAAAIARHAELTRLLLERGADPNDEETPYHVPEDYDNTVTKILLESGRLNEDSLSCMLLRKADWHDRDGLQLMLEHGANPNVMRQFGFSALHQALRRDNELRIVELLLQYGADPALRNARDGKSGAAVAAYRGRGDVLRTFESRGIAPDLQGVDGLIAECAKGSREAAQAIAAREPNRIDELIYKGGTLLAEFAGNGNVDGLRILLDFGVSPASLYKEGDAYFDIAKASTALHVAAWRARPEAVMLLIARGTPVNAKDAKGRTALQLAVKACVDSYWAARRSPDSVAALLNAGATVEGIEIPSGYDEVDGLLRLHL